MRNSLALGSTGEKRLFGPGIIEDAERQTKSYADNRRRDLEFAVGDYVYLKVSPIRGLRRFKVKGKLAPRYIGPFKIIDRRSCISTGIARQIIGSTRCVSCISVEEVFASTEERLREDELNVRDDLTYTEYPVQILETARQITGTRCARLSGATIRREEATWEREDDLKADYPELFASQS
ncbi:LOW QUALITY PROTEIN: hypothetical protein U9M48_025376 [Paspalum notatum var. saurae]|uniref:Tf2-1-like SH3-like domain-containing protein n=1 Tax=Paspalum notatum var. saurae TaxID=547442 RepID=A0AAQ3WX93_PASNO